MKLLRYKCIYLFLIGMLIFQSCSSNQNNKWPFSLPEQKMVELLADIHIAESVYKYKGQYPKDFIPEKLDDVYGMIYAEYSIDKMEVDKLLADLANRPLIMKRVYEKVEKQIKKLEKQAS